MEVNLIDRQACPKQPTCCGITKYVQRVNMEAATDDTHPQMFKRG